MYGFRNLYAIDHPKSEIPLGGANVVASQKRNHTDFEIGTDRGVLKAKYALRSGAIYETDVPLHDFLFKPNKYVLFSYITHKVMNN